MNIMAIFLFYQLWACLRMQHDIIGNIVRLQLPKKKLKQRQLL